VRGDLAREFALDSGALTLQAGVKSRWREKSYDFEGSVYDGYTGTYTLANVLGAPTYRIIDLSPLPDRTAPTDFFNANRANFRINDVDTAIVSSESDYAIDEDVLAGYALARFDTDTFRAIGGVRVERTYNDIRAFVTQTDGDDVTVTPNQVTRDYTDWLPSATLRFEPQRGLVLRLAGYKSLVRPKLSNLAPRVVVNEDDEAEFGNPNLLPYRAWNADASVEWYMSNNSALTAGVFWKSIEDFIVTVRDDNPGTVFGVPYEQADTFVNGETARVKGVELSYAQLFTFLPAPFDGLLVNANYTYTDATGTVFDGDNLTDPREIPLPAAARHTFNVTLGYEKDRVSFRAAGTYRDKYLDELGGAPDEDRYVDRHFQLDLSAKYRVFDGVRLFADWINVTDAPYFAYQNFAGEKRLLQYEKYSWTAKFGVSASF
jgi:TonB-dependent receptor